MMAGRYGRLWLWLDDERDPLQHAPEPRARWEWVKTAEQAIAALKSGAVGRVSLDHDLSDRAAACAATGAQAPNEATGYTVACWMEEHNVWPGGGVECHSMNPVGRARIEAVITRMAKRQEPSA